MKSISIVLFVAVFLIGRGSCFSSLYLTIAARPRHHRLCMVLRDEYMQPHFKSVPTAKDTVTSQSSGAAISSSPSSTRPTASTKSIIKTNEATSSENRSKSSGNFHYHDDNEIDVDELSTMNTSDLLQRYRSIADYESH